MFKTISEIVCLSPSNNLFLRDDGVFAPVTVPTFSVYLSVLLDEHDNDLPAAIASLGTSGQAELVVNLPVLVTAADMDALGELVIPDNVYVSYTGTGIWQTGANSKLVIGWMQDAGSRQIFEGIGDVFFTAGATGGVFRTSWRSGNQISGDISKFFTNLLHSVEGNRGGTIFVAPGDWTVSINNYLPSSLMLKGSGSNYYGYLTGTPNAGGTTLRITQNGGTCLYVGTLAANSANSQRSVVVEDLNVELSGAALTTGKGFLVAGGRTNPTPTNPQQNVYGLVFRNVCFIGGAFPVDFNLTAQAQVEEVLFDHCAFIGGSEKCFRNNTINSSFHFIQPYVACKPGKSGLQFIAVGALNIENRHIVGSNASGLQAHAAIIFGSENASQITDLGDVVLSGGYDEGCEFSWISFAQQDRNPITVIGGLQQGKIRHYGKHDAILTGGTYFRRAFEDAVHPYATGLGGAPLVGNSRFTAIGTKFKNVTYETQLAASLSGAIAVPDGPAGQPHRFTQYSQFLMQSDGSDDATIFRKTVKVFSSQSNDWVIGGVNSTTYAHETGMWTVGSTQPNRSAIQIGDLVKNGSTGIESFSASYNVFRATDATFGQEGYLVIRSSQTGAANQAFRGLDLNGTYRGNGLKIVPSDGLPGNAEFGNNVTIAGSLTTGALQSTANASFGDFASLAKLNVVAATGPQVLIGYSTSVYATASVSSTGTVTLDAVGANPKFSFADAVDVSGNIMTTGFLNAASGFQVNGAAQAGNLLRGNGTSFVGSVVTTADIADSSNRRYVTDAQLAAIGSSAGSLLAANNLSDLTNLAHARSNLGLGPLATQSGSYTLSGNATITGSLTTGAIQSTANASFGDYASLGKINAFTATGAQIAFGYSASVYATISQNSLGTIVYDAVGATPKHYFADPVEVAGNFVASGIVNAVSGFFVNGSALNASHVSETAGRLFLTPAERAAIAGASSYRVLFDYYSPSGNQTANAQNDLYADTIAAGTLNANGQKLAATFTGTFGTGVKTLLVYFNGTLLFDLYFQGGINEGWKVDVLIIRAGGTTATATVSLLSKSYRDVSVTPLTGLNFGAGLNLKIAGSGDAAGNVTAYAGTIAWQAAAV